MSGPLFVSLKDLEVEALRDGAQLTFPGSLSLAFSMFYSLLILLSVLFLQSHMSVFVPQVTQDDTTLHLRCFGPGLLTINVGGLSYNILLDTQL